jgi:hypothetical protein
MQGKDYKIKLIIKKKKEELSRTSHEIDWLGKIEII